MVYGLLEFSWLQTQRTINNNIIINQLIVQFNSHNNNYVPGGFWGRGGIDGFQSCRQSYFLFQISSFGHFFNPSNHVIKNDTVNETLPLVTSNVWNFQAAYKPATPPPIMAISIIFNN